MQSEWLDETIDRVARELTTPAHDRALSTNVRERITRPRRVALAPLLACGAVVAGLVTSLMIWTSIRSEPAAAAQAVLSSRPLAPVAPLRGVASRGVVSRPSTTPQPPATEVAPLEIHVLQLDAIEEAAPLRVDDIRIADMDSDMKAGGVREFR
jgi:hypothetical protein